MICQLFKVSWMCGSVKILRNKNYESWEFLQNLNILKHSLVNDAPSKIIKKNNLQRHFTMKNEQIQNHSLQEKKNWFQSLPNWKLKFQVTQKV